MTPDVLDRSIIGLSAQDRRLCRDCRRRPDGAIARPGQKLPSDVAIQLGIVREIEILKRFNDVVFIFEKVIVGNAPDVGRSGCIGDGKCRILSLSPYDMSENI